MITRLEGTPKKHLFMDWDLEAFQYKQPRKDLSGQLDKSLGEVLTYFLMRGQLQYGVLAPNWLGPHP